MNTNEGNKLIAEFMGLPCPPVYEETPFGEGVGYGYYTPEELKYHSSWDFLMPVIQKLYSLQKGKWYDRVFSINISLSFQDKVDIQTTWEKVLHFIQWYNNQVNQQP